ncbi:MAG: glycosyl transferase, partial [Mycobacterium sp.]|nr:glycosyl transferase [Mycobacterium sp.]
IAGPEREATEHTLNSFVQCCLDVSRVGRFLVLDVGLSAGDRALLAQRYAFVEFVDPDPAGGPAALLAQIRAQIHAPFWLHLGQGWRFFAPENLITRLTGVLAAEPGVFQVAINYLDALTLTATSAPETAVGHSPDAGRYVLTESIANGPAMFDTARLDRAGGMPALELDPIPDLERRAAAAGLRTASLDEVLCITAI